MRKRMLLVINTLGRAGAETALLELLRHLDPKRYDVSLYVLMNQGEMARELPDHVRLVNRRYADCSVLTRKGQRKLAGQVLRAMAARGTAVRLAPYLCGNLGAMLRKRDVRVDKLLWRVLSDGGQRMEERYDLAVSFLEGGSAYYVADHVDAKKKAAFIHVDYEQAGYTRALDRDCYLEYDKIFTVSDEVKAAFLKAYPECGERTEVFHNILNREKIREGTQLPGGFGDGFDGLRLLTMGRLTRQKALEVSIAAMRLLKDAGEPVRWYVLGEGDQRSFLEERIRTLGLERDFLLPGAVSNPYPYLRQADIYVHASRFEGKSIAIQEAQVLGKPILVSDCSGNREQVDPGVDGLMCDLSPESVCREIQKLIRDERLRERLGRAAARRPQTGETEIQKLLSLLEPGGAA